MAEAFCPMRMRPFLSAAGSCVVPAAKLMRAKGISKCCLYLVISTSRFRHGSASPASRGPRGAHVTRRPCCHQVLPVLLSGDSLRQSLYTNSPGFHNPTPWMPERRPADPALSDRRAANSSRFQTCSQHRVNGVSVSKQMMTRLAARRQRQDRRRSGKAAWRRSWAVLLLAGTGFSATVNGLDRWGTGAVVSGWSTKWWRASTP